MAKSAACSILRPSDVAKAKKAYADMRGRRDEADYNWSFDRPRSKGKFFSASEFCHMTKEAVPGGYNEFSTDRFCSIIEKSKACFRLGREGSVAVYARGPGADGLLKKRRAMRADEADVRRGIVRLWWD